MIATPDDVHAGIRSLWAAVGLDLVFTGGLHDARAIPAVLVPPYAVVAVRTGERMTMSSFGWTEQFMVMVWVVTDVTMDRAMIGRALARLNWSRSWPALRGNALHVKPLAMPADPPPLPNLSRDVAVTAAGWEVLMQQSA